MKYTFITAATACLLGASLQAATVVDSYQSAKDKVGDDGFVIIAYPDGWNAKNKKLAEDIMQSPEFQKSAGKACILAVGFSNVTTKEEREARDRKLGAIKLAMGTGATLSFPVIFLNEASGRNYAVINSQEFRDNKQPEPEFTQVAIRNASKLVKQRIAGLKEQRELLTQAESASGKVKIDKLAATCNITGIARPDKIVDIVAKADPKDEYGLKEALTHNMYGFIEGSARDKDWQARIADIEKKLRNPYFTPEVRQTLCTTAFGLLRRNGGPDQREKMFNFLREMKTINPNNFYGKSYDGAMRMWDSWTSTWSPDIVPQKDGPMEIKGAPIKEAGTYEVTLRYNSGKHALLAKSVALYDGDTMVVEDEHRCFAGHRLENNVYTLRVPRAVSKPRLIINTIMGNNRDSRGTVIVQQQ